MRRVLALCLALALPACVPMELMPPPAPMGPGPVVNPMVAPTVPAEVTASQKLKNAEERFQAVMRSLDRMEKRGQIRDTAARRSLAAMIEVANDTIQDAHDSVILGPMSSSARQIELADDAVSALVTWYNARKEKM